MVPKANKGTPATTTVEINGREYRRSSPPSEQPDVLIVTRRLGRGTAKVEVRISEDELRHFARVFPRLYQVAKKSRDRLLAWKGAHLQEVQNWDLGGFFNTKEDDKNAGSEPRKAGIPDIEAEPVEEQKSEVDEGSTSNAPKKSPVQPAIRPVRICFIKKPAETAEGTSTQKSVNNSKRRGKQAEDQDDEEDYEPTNGRLAKRLQLIEMINSGRIDEAQEDALFGIFGLK
ncbi:hypothetical protein N0V88_002668 [Collariella sp. IMI 366227]|nr:hypothetical protein N0V88_002668 [Collariella sp. IMI 366227]